MRAARKLIAFGAAALLAIGMASAVSSDVAGADSPTASAWTGSGDGGTVTSDGTAGAPQFSYSVNREAGDFAARNWTFTTTAASAGSVTVPYDYRGSHAYFEVTVSLQAIVIHNGVTTTTSIVNAGPQDCTPAEGQTGCPTPSGSFAYSGTTTLSVQAGDTYGFAFSGNNFDTNNFLQGTLTVPSTAYIAGAPLAQNTSWTTAALLTTAGLNGTLTAPGEARWFKFPVVPSSQIKVDLTNLDQNYDLTLYTDIGAAFTTLTSTTDLNTLGAEQSGNAYSPSIYSPSIYSPSIYSPSIYSPSIYSPSIYSPSIYSPSIYSPSIYSPSIYSPSIYSPSIYSPSIYSPSIYSPSSAFLQAFSDAQARSLIGVSALDGTAPETISAATWNNTGYFYVRVQGRNGVNSATPFHLALTNIGGPCSTPLSSFPNDTTLIGTPGSAQTAIVTDSSRLVPTAALTTDLAKLATATGGVVVDVKNSQLVHDLNAQADANPSCAYAKNLVAAAIRSIVNSYRNPAGTLKYVAIIGGDSVIPFFRYPDTAGIGPESGYVPPVLGTSASQAVLGTNDVLGQDAYGAVSDLSLKGSVLPVPDLAVGRLVETAAEIDGQIANFLGLSNGTLPTPTSSLVTGYDFLTTAADSVQATLAAGLGTGAGVRTDQLITNQGVPTTKTTVGGVPSRTTSWTATDLSNALFNTRHDVVFLAGHFSANSTLAADYSTSLITTDFAAHPTQFTNSLVFSAGCHSGYNIVDADGVPGLTLDLDWSQEMAQQKAILIAGTGYQYADTDFLAYSAKLYTMLATQLQAGTGAVSIGQALVKAKQAYLEGLASVSGIDQKSIIESTMYGLPMTAINLPGARTGDPAAPAPAISPSPVSAGTPGATLGLTTATVNVSSANAAHTRAALDLNGNPTSTTFSWWSGTNGTLTQPALPAVPEQIVPATSNNGTSLRGVGFRSGTYADTPGVTPLTGAPTTEQNGLHTTFNSPVFFPQNLFSINYFDALGVSNSTKQTSVIVTPAQYRSDSVTSTTDTFRNYANLGLSLFYSKNTTIYGQNTPALAQAPSITGVASTVSSDGTTVTISAHVTGDPSAGIQQVWATYTATSGPFYGAWNSIDLAQSGTDSTLWSATLTLPSGQNAANVQFMLQAVNGVGLVGVDNNLGYYYSPVTSPAVTPVATTLTLDPVASSVAYGANLTVGAKVATVPAGSVVTFDVGGQGSVSALTDSTGHATASIRMIGNPGSFQLTASYAGDSGHLSSSARSGAFTVTKAATALVLGSTKKVFAVGNAPTLPSLRLDSSGAVASTKSTGLIPVFNIDTGLVATLTSNGQPVPQRSVVFTLKGILFRQTVTATRTTDLNGNAILGVVPLVPDVYTLRATFGTATAGTATDPVFAASSTVQASIVLAPGLPITIVLPSKK